MAAWQGLKDTTKARDGLQRVPLMMGIGDAVFVNDISVAEVRSAAAVLRTLAGCSDADLYAHSAQQNNNVVVVPAKEKQPVAI